MTNGLIGLTLFWVSVQGLADTYTARWSEVTEREDGSPVSTVSYEVWQNGVLLWTGSDTQYSMELVEGANFIQIISREGHRRSAPLNYNLHFEPPPPKKPETRQEIN